MNKNASKKAISLEFQSNLLAWFDQYGRKTLPWQQKKTPYRVWVSEIMLQQTQVTTVIDYYDRFMKKFPTIQKLAKASEDEVLHLWTGLGYYSRARNLHKTAKIVASEYQGKFPHTVEALTQLPGIGKSTAGAIISIAFEQPATILDGNVKRVLTRFYGITEWPGEKDTEKQLWKIATQLTPAKRTAHYTQAIMDLGATLCTRGQPNCSACPFETTCRAHALGIEKTLPKSKPKKALPIRYSTLLLIHHNESVLLKKRPPTGIWGGLWVPEEIKAHADQVTISEHCKKQFNLSPNKIQLGEIFRHTFSHFHLDILPAYIHATKTKTKIMEDEKQIWYKLDHSQQIGLPAPIKKLLQEMT